MPNGLSASNSALAWVPTPAVPKQVISSAPPLPIGHYFALRPHAVRLAARHAGPEGRHVCSTPDADIPSRAGERGSVVVRLDTVRFEFGHGFSIYLLHR